MEVMAFAPEPMVVRDEPQSAEFAIQTFMLSWSKTVYVPLRKVSPRMASTESEATAPK